MPRPSIPYLSVVIPTYNRADIVCETVASFLSLDSYEFELLVVDDGSTDCTLNNLSLFSDSRLRVFHVENGERGRARNIGAQFARGRYCYSYPYVKR